MKYVGKYDGLIFDCDGTLVDTMPMHYVSWHKAFTSHGMTFTEERFYELGGVPPVKVVGIIAEENGVSLDDPEQVADRKENMFFDLMKQIDPIDHTLSVVRAHHGHLPMAVASGSPRKSVRMMLDSLELMPLFHAWLGAEDAEHGKPAPDIFLEAADRLKVKPEKCVVYEDAEAGMEAARQAGMDVVDVRTYHTPKRMTEELHRY